MNLRGPAVWAAMDRATGIVLSLLVATQLWRASHGMIIMWWSFASTMLGVLAAALSCLGPSGRAKRSVRIVTVHKVEP